MSNNTLWSFRALTIQNFFVTKKVESQTANDADTLKLYQQLFEKSTQLNADSQESQNSQNSQNSQMYNRI